MGKNSEKTSMDKQVFNPYLPEGVYIPDGEPHVFGDRVYIYGSHDKFNSLRYCPGDYEVWSAPVTDLTAWKNEGVIYRRKGRHNLFGYHCMWAPDVCRGADGRYYLYYCLDWKGYVCVAVCDMPAGKYEYLGRVHYPDGTLYGKGKKDIMCFDPAVLADGEGAYLYSGFSANEDLRRMLRFKGIKNVDGTGGQVIRLGKDMLTVLGEPKMLLPGYKNSVGTGFEGHEMYEASSIRKVDNKYYFIYSTRKSHELAYAVSDYPDREFRFGGVLISNGDIGCNGKSEAMNYWGNNHGSIEKIDGQWYVFYHRQTNRTEQSRQGCAEKIQMDREGNFNFVEMTSCGLNKTPLKGYGRYPAYIACNLRSATGAVKCAYGPFSKYKYKLHPFITEYRKNKQCIMDMRHGAMAGFKYFDFLDSVMLHVTTRGSAGKLVVSNKTNGIPLAIINLSASKNWKSESCCLMGLQGVNALYFTYYGKGKIDFLDFTLEKIC